MRQNNSKCNPNNILHKFVGLFLIWNSLLYFCYSLFHIFFFFVIFILFLGSSSFFFLRQELFMNSPPSSFLPSLIITSELLILDGDPSSKAFWSHPYTRLSLPFFFFFAAKAATQFKFFWRFATATKKNVQSNEKWFFFFILSFFLFLKSNKKGDFWLRSPELWSGFSNPLWQWRRVRGDDIKKNFPKYLTMVSNIYK